MFCNFRIDTVNGFTVEYGKNEYQILFKIVVTIYATESVTFGKVLVATNRCQQDYY